MMTCNSPKPRTNGRMCAPPRITPDQLRRALRYLDITQRGFAVYTGANERTVRRWCDGDLDVPPWVARMLELMGARWD